MEDLNIVLIRLVKGHPVIFEKQSRTFKNATLKKKSWLSIVGDFFKKTGIEISVTQASNRWDLLKAGYTEVRRNNKTYIPSGSAASADTNKNSDHWMYYSEMNFLKESVDHADTTETFQNTRSHINEEENQEEFEEYGYQDTEGPVGTGDIFHFFPVPSTSAATAEENVDIRSNNMSKLKKNDVRTERLLVIDDMWKRISEKNRVPCYRELKKLITKDILLIN
ncbi:uncharacterized protein LOC127279585 [Leptopilina boulardi]|uniref:uncharacterized protein LOC127279585 n=1 Tax=Leptopilina boulardi TaxID=63433 RepID=UPI0021F5A1C5|nr:uncharacterized protein LOC127279585 [Leptopilina boulardi]